MSKAVIRFENVSKYYPLYHHITGGVKNLLLNFPSAMRSFRKTRFEALKDISFEINQGETFGIVGKNGAGKSTMLGLIAGVLKPTVGKITVNGRISPLLELGAGFHPELSGRENILLNGVLLGLSRRDVLAKMNDIIDFSELDSFIEQPIRTYSSGMLARLGFSVVAHLDSEILLVDEILAVGDMNFQEKCVNKMSQFKKNGATIVLVSHTASAVAQMCDRAMWIDNHTIKMLGNAGDVTDAYITKQATLLKLSGSTAEISITEKG